MAWWTRFFSNSKPTKRDAPTLPPGVYRNSVAGPLDDLPDWIRVVPLGAYPEHHAGGYEVLPEHLAEMHANLVRFNASSGLLFDIDHESLWGNSRAAGWAYNWEVRDDGLYVERPTWTPYGEPFVNGREYACLSPVFALAARDNQGQPIGARLLSVGLTNTPFFDDGEIGLIGNTDTPPPTPETDPNANLMDREKLIKKLGLADDATDADIEAAIEALQQQEAETPEAEPETPETPEEEEDATKANSAMTARIAALEKQFAARAAAEQTTQAETLVDEAIANGKLRRSDRDAYVNWAKLDFAACQAKLGGVKANSALPGGSKVPDTPANGEQGNQSFAEYFASKNAA